MAYLRHYVAYLKYQIAKTDIVTIGVTQGDRLLEAIFEPLGAYKLFLVFLPFLPDCGPVMLTEYPITLK